eukprot:EC786616.1.p3 GENE.EC786616.1~~EC786616.1.p3  ORF type:complete len:83 (+),score=26.96 EC786616.1:143-391(+)
MDKFPVITEITLPKRYPREQFTAQMQALDALNVQRSEPITCKVVQMPYSDTWTIEEQVIQMRDYVAQVVPNFRKIAHPPDSR